MECPSCYEYFDADSRVPRNLQCGHTFCEVCLVKIEQQRLTFCPLCKTGLQKPFKAKKLPKNYLALEYASKHHEMTKNSNFCPIHPKELMRHFWQRWIWEWLPSLSARKKWFKDKGNFC